MYQKNCTGSTIEKKWPAAMRLRQVFAWENRKIQPNYAKISSGQSWNLIRARSADYKPELVQNERGFRNAVSECTDNTKFMIMAGSSRRHSPARTGYQPAGVKPLKRLIRVLLRLGDLGFHRLESCRAGKGWARCRVGADFIGHGTPTLKNRAVVND